MNIINCTWDEANLKKKTAEIIIDQNYDLDSIRQVINEYDYVVVKAPSCKIDLYRHLMSLGFYFVESQLSLHFKASQLNYLSKMGAYYIPKTALELCENEKQIEDVIDYVSTGLFTTDRIALDSNFGIQIANRRYINWIRNTISCKNYQLFNIIVSSMKVGFCYVKEVNNTVDYVLGGLYPEFKGKGFGIVEPLSACIYMRDNLLKSVDTNVSSNNINVLKCYMECGYTIEKIMYVFAKIQ